MPRSALPTRRRLRSPRVNAVQHTAYSCYAAQSSDKHFVKSSLTIYPIFIAAATDVADEPLHIGFSGLLGLSLPRNSVIAQLLSSGAPNGTSVTSNLFGQPTTPNNHFFAISLSRPGFDDRDISWHAWPSKLALGTQIPEVVNALAALHTNSSVVTTRHARSILSPAHTLRQADRSTNDPSQLAWAQVLSAPSGYLHWRTQISEIIVTDDRGIEKSVTLGRSLVDNGQTSLWPVAVLDTGGSSIYMRSDLANGLYGAIGIGPASDGICKPGRSCESSTCMVQFLTNSQITCHVKLHSRSQ